MNAIENGSIADETCDALCRAAREKSLELGIDISFAVADADELPRMFRRFGDALVPAKAHTAAVTRLSTGELAKCAAEGGPLFGINSADPRIVFVAGGFPLSVGGKVVGGIGIGGGSEAQDMEIGERVVEVFNKIANWRG